MERIMPKKSKITAAAGSSGGKSVVDNKRKHLSDLTNLNLIPTDNLRKLCSNSISASDAQSLLWKSQAPVIPILQNSNSSKSVTSIASSNFNSVSKFNARNPTLKNDEDCELVSHGERQSTANLEKQGKINSSTINSRIAGKANDRGKFDSLPSRTPRGNHGKNTQKAAVVSTAPTPFEKEIAERKSIVGPVSCASVQKLNKANAAATPPKVSQSEKKKDKAKATVTSFSSGSYYKTKDKGKTVSVPWCSPSDQIEDNRKAIPMVISSPQPNKRKESIVVPLSSTTVPKLKDKHCATAAPPKVNPSEKTKDKGKATIVSFSSSSYYKTKDKGKAVAMPSSTLSESTENNGKPTPVLINCPKPNNGKESSSLVVSASSCPPLRRKRNTRDDGYQADLASSRAWTYLCPKGKKRRCIQKQTASGNSLPEEFVKQQRAYFREVDDFELEVVEALNNDAD